MKIPFEIDLSGKCAVITGAGGVLCSDFAKAIAQCGASVALLDINAEAVKKVAEEIGENALAVPCNCLDKASIEEAKREIEAKLGTVNFLINGAGGNSPLGTTTKDTLELKDMAEKAEGVKTFFDLDAKGIEFVFNLNFLDKKTDFRVLSKHFFNKGWTRFEFDGLVNINIDNPGKLLPIWYNVSKSDIQK